MSIWNSVKPAKKMVVASDVTLSADRKSLDITWNNGTKISHSAQKLRQLCPCAECVEEWSGRRTVKPESIPQDITIVDLAPVGNYAITMTFGDAHRTGIYNWEYLLELQSNG